MIGILILGLVVWLPHPGQVAADTKLALAVNPWGFLREALTPWSDLFTLGGLQNQAYGYLFPQGLFFALIDWLPDWVTQRLWWWLLVSLAYLGMVRLLRTVTLGTASSQTIAGVLYALSPRILTTLTAISSEAWPVALVPWIVYPLLHPQLNRRPLAQSLLAVACLGAVNAAATLAALVPALIVLIWRRQITRGLIWCAGTLALSVWWLVPLIILGRFSPPFTEFIESATTTTRWLGLLEVLRGTTSWAPFVDVERTAGVLLNAPIMVVATVLVAGIGLAGLSRLRSRLWVAMLLTGVAVFAVAALVPQLFDGPLAAFRNVHKFDPVVRLPLMVGVAAALTPRPSPRTVTDTSPRSARLVAAILVTLAATAPAWSGRLLPVGAYTQIPDYWTEAADHIAQSPSRVLITPPAQFARQSWGWTRDEPLQPLLTERGVPWATRDAIPLVNPESIRGLDGLMAVLETVATTPDLTQALTRFGIGHIVVRHDLIDTVGATDWSAEKLAAAIPGASITHYGAGTAEEPGRESVDIVSLPKATDTLSVATSVIPVAGGGEIVALLDAINPSTTSALSPYLLTPTDSGSHPTANPTIVTDTPALVARNYGAAATQNATSAFLTHEEAEGGRTTTGVANRLVDYPSAGTPTAVVETGGHITASSQASDAMSLGGSNPAESITAAVDGVEETAWYPGLHGSGWIELTTDTVDTAPTELVVTTTASSTVTVHAGDWSQPVETVADEPATVRFPASRSVRIEVPAGTGVAEAHLTGADITREVTVPPAPDTVQQFVFQQLMVPTGHLIRTFTVPHDMEVVLRAGSNTDEETIVTIDGTDYATVPTSEPITLTAAPHRLSTTADWVSLTVPNPQLTVPLPTTSDGATIALTGRSANPGLQADLGGVPAEPITIDAGLQGFVLPTTATDVTVSFSPRATGIYRAGLIGGGVLWLIVVGGCMLGRCRGPRPDARGDGLQTPAIAGFMPPCIRGLGTRTPLIAAGLGVPTIWYCYAPWPDPQWPGTSLFTTVFALVALAAAVFPTPEEPDEHQSVQPGQHQGSQHPQ